jgi:hypothetical protein
METLNEHDLIYDWNVYNGARKPSKAIEFDDKTRRDGLQSPFKFIESIQHHPNRRRISK